MSRLTGAVIRWVTRSEVWHCEIALGDAIVGYLTRDGDLLDEICKRELGSEVHVPAMLEANAGLAGRGPVYPAGLVIQLPEAVVAPVIAGQIRLWGRT